MPANVAGVNDAGSPQDWFRDIPIITKILVVSTVLSAAVVSFGLIAPHSLIFYWPTIYEKFEIWRLFTSVVFAGPFKFPFLMHTYMLYQNSLRYEQNAFNTGARGTSADFLWMILFCTGILWVVSYVFDRHVLSEPLLFVIMYVRSRREPEALANIFGFKFRAIYLPWVYVAFRLLIGESIVGPLIGIAVGHLYYFLVSVLPASHNTDLLRTPEFCVSFVEWSTGYSQPGLQPPRAPTSASTRPANVGGFNRGGYNWGSGRTLGTN